MSLFSYSHHQHRCVVVILSDSQAHTLKRKEQKINKNKNLLIQNVKWTDNCSTDAENIRKRRFN